MEKAKILEKIRKGQGGYISIFMPDESGAIALHYSKEEKCIKAFCSFPLSGNMGLVDSVDTLGYVRVESAETIEGVNAGRLKLACLKKPAECLERLMEDLPKVMEEWL